MKAQLPIADHRRRRTRLAVLGLTVAALLLLLPAVAEAQACSGYFFTNWTCEKSHHVPLFGLTGSTLALVILLMLQAGFADAATGLMAQLWPRRPEKAPQPPLPPPAPAGPPPLIDPWTGEPMIVQDGSYEGGELGQYWLGGRWVDREEVLDWIERSLAAMDRREQEQAEFQAGTEAGKGRWRQRLQDQVEQERLDRERWEAEWEANWTAFENVQRYSIEHGYDELVARLGNAFNEDGSLNMEYVNQMKQVLKNHINRDTAAPDETLDPSWVGEFVAETGVPLARITLGIFTQGTSEIFFQSLAVHQALEKEMERRANAGEDFNIGDSLRTVLGAMARENLPINTYEALKDPNASAGDVMLALAFDGFVVLGGAETARNLRGSLNRATHGAGWKEVLTHRADALDMMKPFRGQRDGAVPGRTADAAVGGRTADIGSSARARQPVSVSGAERLSRLPPRVQEAVNRARNESLRRPGGRAMDDAFEAGRARGQKKVEALDQAHRDLDTARAGGDPQRIATAESRVRDTTLDVQKDKNALHALNNRAKASREGGGGGGHDPSVEGFNKAMDDIYKQTDDAVRGRLANDPENIRAKIVTNLKEGEVPTGPRKDKVSYDRDVTYEQKKTIIDENGNKVDVWEDVPSNKAKEVYEEEFYRASTGGEPPLNADGTINRKALEEYADEMDQVVTDYIHTEAYGRGQMDLDTATKDQFRGRDLTDPHQVGDAVTYKSDHWRNRSIEALERGDTVGAVANLEEAQRQLIKQHDNMVVGRTEAMVQAGNAPGAVVPQGLQQQVDVLKLVDDGILTPGQAEAVLESMGSSTGKLADGMGGYVAGLQVLRRPGW